MIRRIRIKGYKSLKNVDVRFAPLTVFFGANAAGKSNLFDSLALLSSMTTQRTLQEAFEVHRGTPFEAFFHGEEGIESLLKQQSASFEIEADISLSKSVIERTEKQIADMRKGLGEEDKNGHKHRITETELRYLLKIEITTDSGHLRVVEERLSALNKDGEIKYNRKPFIEKTANHLTLRMEGQSRPTHYDVGLDHTLLSAPMYAPHYPHITALREEFSRWRFYYLEPKRSMRSDNPLQEALSLDSSGGNLAAFYNSLKVNHPRQFTNVLLSLRSILPHLEKIDVERTRTGELQLKVFEDGVPFPASVVSEGTLRVLGLFAIVNAPVPASIVGYEEPENGVHPRRLSIIAKLLETVSQYSETQILVNTHSPTFPQYLSEASIINCKKEGRATRFDAIPVDLFLSGAIQDGLEDKLEKNNMSFASMVLRGDFGG